MKKIEETFTTVKKYLNAHYAGKDFQYDYFPLTDNSSLEIIGYGMGLMYRNTSVSVDITPLIILFKELQVDIIELRIFTGIAGLKVEFKIGRL